MGEQHLRALRGVPAAELRAVADPEPARRERLRRLFGAPRSYAGLEPLLADPGVTAVILCLPARLAAEAAVTVLRSGRALLAEKPVAVSWGEIDSLAGAGAASASRVQVGFHLRRHQLFRAARGWLEEGRLGRLLAVRSTLTNSREPAGDVLLDLGVHHFDLWRHLTGGEVRSLDCRSAGDRTVMVSAQLDGGALATALLSHESADQNELELHGTLGRLRISDYRLDGWEFQPLGSPPGRLAERLVRLTGLLRDLPGRLRFGSWREQAYRSALADFVVCLEEGRLPSPGLSDGLKASAIALTARESLERGQTTTVRW